MSERDPYESQQYTGLRELGYPVAGPAAPAAPDAPAVIVERQARLSAALTEIHSHQPCRPAIVVPGTVPVADEDLDAWIDAAPAERKRLHREVARALCFLARFAGGGAWWTS